LFNPNRKGQGGTVYEGLMDGNTPVAMKKLHTESVTGTDEFFTEAAILQQLRHPNVLQVTMFDDILIVCSFLESILTRKRIIIW
jgi:hypothetical protein